MAQLQKDKERGKNMSVNESDVMRSGYILLFKCVWVYRCMIGGCSCSSGHGSSLRTE